MVIYDHVFKEDGRPKLPVEEVKDWPRSFIPPLSHYYKQISINCGFTPPIGECVRCERRECTNCYSYCPWCGGEFEKKR